MIRAKKIKELTQKSYSKNLKNYITDAKKRIEKHIKENALKGRNGFSYCCPEDVYVDSIYLADIYTAIIEELTKSGYHVTLEKKFENTVLFIEW